MISIEKCYEILNKNEVKYSYKQVQDIRELMNQLADIIYNSRIEKDEKFDRKTCNSVSKSKYH